ncbi:MAG TPA: hypothetical protein ENH24_00710 [Nitrospirae bacterium]|nr:hypothetical protein [Nitrospirota bacterium]
MPDETKTMKFLLLLFLLLMPVEAFSWSGCATNAFVNELRRSEETGNSANLILNQKNYSLHELKRLLSPVIQLFDEKAEYIDNFNPLYQPPTYYTYFSDNGEFTPTVYEPGGIPYSNDFKGISLEFDIMNNLRFTTLKKVRIGISFTTEGASERNIAGFSFSRNFTPPDSTSIFILKDKLYPGRKTHVRWFAKTSSPEVKSLQPVIYAVSIIPENIDDSFELYEKGINEYDAGYCR